MGFQLDERVKLHEPLGFHDYNHLQMNAFAVVSDSGTLPEESSFFTSVGHPFPLSASVPPPSDLKHWTKAALCWPASARAAWNRRLPPPLP